MLFRFVKPAPPAEPTTEQKERGYYGNRRTEMLPFVPKGTRTVLDVGCGRGAFGSNVRETIGAKVWGVELNAEAARIASARLDHVLNADINSAISQLPAGSFDCISFNDILEHLVDPYSVLDAVRPLLSPTGVVIASLPNIRHGAVMWELLWKGRWDYADCGILDRTHLRFFTVASMRALFENNGYRVRQITGINPEVRTRLGRLAARIAPPRFRDMQFMQFAIVGEPKR